MAWAIDRRAVLLLLACQVATGVAAAVPLTATARAMTPLLGAGAMADRLRAALPALLVVACASATARTALAVARYAERRITPRLTTATDTALVEAVCRSGGGRLCGGRLRRPAGSRRDGRDAYAGHGDGRPALTVGPDQVVTAGAVVTVLNPLVLPLLLLAVAPAASAIRSGHGQRGEAKAAGGRRFTYVPFRCDCCGRERARCQAGGGAGG